MRVAVIGAGAVGGTLAALLSCGGHDVEVVARGAHLDEILRRGIHLAGAWGDHTALIEASSELQRTPDLAIVATKAQDAEAAMRTAARLLDGVPVVIVQNGLGSVATGRAALPGSEVIGALALFAASYLAPGEIVVTATGRLYLDGSTTRSASVADVLRAVLPVSVTADFVGAQWTKLVVNQINALPAITGLSAQEVISHRGLRRIMAESMRETVRVGLDSGVRFAPLQGMSHRMLLLFHHAPAAFAGLLPLAMARRMGPTPNPGSTLQSIRRGQPTEIDHLSGAVVEAAAAAGGQATINAVLVRMVHEVEGGRRFLTPDEVMERVRQTTSRSGNGG
ncbi:MAG TPA: 2-dehydropantoate 2-reductase [Marisediminicola sp.]|jgi:2-dehydropantoate 2-reductase|nr:2-dehydropantoate 2-reductase [Marisediminicola sp.]